MLGTQAALALVPWDSCPPHCHPLPAVYNPKTYSTCLPDLPCCEHPPCFQEQRWTPRSPGSTGGLSLRSMPFPHGHHPGNSATTAGASDGYNLLHVYCLELELNQGLEHSLPPHPVTVENLHTGMYAHLSIPRDTRVYTCVLTNTDTHTCTHPPSQAQGQARMYNTALHTPRHTCTYPGTSSCVHGHPQIPRDITTNPHRGTLPLEGDACTLLTSARL